MKSRISSNILSRQKRQINRLLGFLVIMMFLIPQAVQSQIFVQLEIYNSPDVQKYSVGDRFVFRTKEFPDEWQKKKIREIQYENNIIMFDRTFVHVDDITLVRTFNPLPATLAKGLYIFGAQALLFGGISSIIDGSVSWTLPVYVLGSAGLGAFLDVIAFKRHRMGVNSRIRLLDLRIY